jgi:hypothetical protein
MHGSGNFVFVAAVPRDSCNDVEAELVWRGKDVLAYNNFGRKVPPAKRVRLVHVGDIPDFREFES